MNEGMIRNAIIAVRFIQSICVAAFILGMMWYGADILVLPLHGFLMLYGAVGMAVSEIAARLLSQKARKFREQKRRK